jgi:hypothetical protein
MFCECECHLAAPLAAETILKLCAVQKTYMFFGLVLSKTLARTTGFLLFAEPKPCYVRAMEICSTFSAAYPLNMVAWSGIEPLTRGFSTHVAPKSSMFTGLAAGFRVTCYRPCYTKTTLFCNTFASHKSLYHSCKILQCSVT